MGLDTRATGLPGHMNYHGSYGRYYSFRKEILRRCYGERFAYIFGKWEVTEKDEEDWNQICDEDLDLFILHSDCDGKFTPKECARVYNALCKIEIKEDDPEWFIKDLDTWKGIFHHCKKRRVNLYYC